MDPKCVVCDSINDLDKYDDKKCSVCDEEFVSDDNEEELDTGVCSCCYNKDYFCQVCLKTVDYFDGMYYCDSCDRYICYSCEVIGWCQAPGTCKECFDTRFICDGCKKEVFPELPIVMDSGEKYKCINCYEEHYITLENDQSNSE